MKKKRGKKNNSSRWNQLNVLVNKNFNGGIDFVKQSKNYIWFTVILFFVVGIFGYFYPFLFQDKLISLIEDLVGKTQDLSTLELIGFIFLNNLKSSFFSMFFGIFFAIAPLFSTIANGYILGFVSNIVVSQEGPLILWRLLPHGIFEIPAILISIGVGVKLGLFLILGPKKNRKREFYNYIKGASKVFVFIIIPLLLIAAIIEGILIYSLS